MKKLTLGWMSTNQKLTLGMGQQTKNWPYERLVNKSDVRKNA